MVEKILFSHYCWFVISVHIILCKTREFSYFIKENLLQRPFCELGSISLNCEPKVSSKETKRRGCFCNKSLGPDTHLGWFMQMRDVGLFSSDRLMKVTADWLITQLLSVLGGVVETYQELVLLWIRDFIF